VALLALLLALFAVDSSAYEWQLPTGFPVPLVPADNPMTEAKVRLGRKLFADPRLSRNGQLSCASCHDPQQAFSDPRARSVGALGDELPLNSPSLWNVAYYASLGWTDSGKRTLEEQHLLPLTNTAPVEMGLQPAQVAALWQDATLRSEVKQAFGDVETLRLEHLTYALASYLRTLMRAGTAFDRYLFEDDATALNPQQREGLALFLSPRLNCTGCHRGTLLSGPTASESAVFEPTFYATGVGSSDDAFRAPSLRFVSETAPYMHDGSMSTLSQVIRFYEHGGGNAGQHLQPFTLTDNQREALMAFLLSL